MIEQPSGLKNLSLLSNVAAKRRHEAQITERGSQNTFSVNELSLRDDKSSRFATVGMVTQTQIYIFLAKIL